MRSNAKKKTRPSEDFVLMGNTRELLADLWDQWKADLGQTPDVAKRMMTAAINEMHTAETKAAGKLRRGGKSLKKSVKSTARKAVNKVTKKTAKGMRKKAKI